MKTAKIYLLLTLLLSASGGVIIADESESVPIEDWGELWSEQSPLPGSRSFNLSKGPSKIIRIGFASGSAELRLSRTTAASLNNLAAFLKANPKKSLIIEGHTDTRGSDAYNLALSQRRARSVQNYLQSKGVRNRTKAVGYGEKYPVYDKDSLNRRVVFKKGN